MEDQIITIFPNPVQHQLHIQLERASNLNYELLDLAGRIILSNKSFNNSIELDLSALTQGTYLLKIASPLSHEVVLNKVVKVN